MTYETSARRFLLKRNEDPVGISGTGVIGEGVEMSNGKCCVTFLTRYRSVTVYDSMREVVNIHCHGGATEIIWIDKANGSVPD